MQAGGLLPFIVALAFSFCFFAFFANSLNPFATPGRTSSRLGRVKYFRYAAIALFFSVSLAVALYQYNSQPMSIAAIAGAVFYAILILVPSIRYYGMRLPFSSASKKSQRKSRGILATQEESVTLQTGIAERQVKERTHASTLAIPSTDNEIELQQRNFSEEYATEMHKIAKATAHIDYELTNSEQPVAEASKSSYLNSVMDVEFDTPEVDSKITALQNEHDSLANTHELLKSENAKLQIDLQRKESEKNQALEVKNKAIRLAAVERNRRKLTEVQAKKVILKLKKNAQQKEAKSSNT